MSGRAGLSISARITVAVFLATFTCGLAAVVLCKVDRDAARVRDYLARVRGWARIGASQVAEAGDARPAHTVPADTSRAPEPFRRWSWAMLQNPEVVAALLVDRQGRILAQAPQRVGVSGLDRVDDSGEVVVRRTLRVAGVERDVYAAFAPVRRAPEDASVGHVVVLAFADGARADVAGFERVVLGIAVAVGLITWLAGWWARRSVGRPLSVLVRGSADLRIEGTANLVLGRGDELGDLGRAICGLADRLQRAEVRAEALETTLQSRVADRTRRIEAMLNEARKDIFVDSLTQLYNRRFLDAKLEGLVRDQLAAGEDLAVIALDIDHFKQVNDTLGHAAGDDLLAFTGELLRATLRNADVGVRLGGDEFVVLLFNASTTEATAMARRLVRLFGQRAGLLRVGAPVGLSGGVASLRESRVQTGHDLLRAADAALYQAKRRGKDAVQAASAPR